METQKSIELYNKRIKEVLISKEEIDKEIVKAGKYIDAIYDGIADKTALMEALMEMYAETLSTLTDNNDEGNVTWTASW